MDTIGQDLERPQPLDAAVVALGAAGLLVLFGLLARPHQLSVWLVAVALAVLLLTACSLLRQRLHAIRPQEPEPTHVLDPARQSQLLYDIGLLYVQGEDDAVIVDGDVVFRPGKPGDVVLIGPHECDGHVKRADGAIIHPIPGVPLCIGGPSAG